MKKTLIALALLFTGIINSAEYARRNNALIDAAANGNREITEILIKAGADLNFQNNYGNTALTYAAHWGRREIVKLLIEHGADTTIKNHYYKSFLDLIEKPEYSAIKKVYQESIRSILLPFLTQDTAGIVASYCA